MARSYLVLAELRRRGSGLWGRHAVAADKCRGEDPSVTEAVASADLSQQQVEAGGGDRFEVRADCGQRRDEVFRLRHVVETDHADVRRYEPATFVQRPQNAKGEVVIGGEYGGHVVHPGQDLAGAVAGGRGPVGWHERRDFGARLGQGSLPPGDAPLTVEPVA